MEISKIAAYNIKGFKIDLIVINNILFCDNLELEFLRLDYYHNIIDHIFCYNNPYLFIRLNKYVKYINCKKGLIDINSEELNNDIIIDYNDYDLKKLDNDLLEIFRINPNNITYNYFDNYFKPSYMFFISDGNLIVDDNIYNIVHNIFNSFIITKCYILYFMIKNNYISVNINIKNVVKYTTYLHNYIYDRNGFLIDNFPITNYQQS